MGNNKVKALVLKRDYDILNLLNSISNFEIFTPFEVALNMVELLPVDVFKDPNSKFLDPAVKSGIFLREIIYKLNDYLPRTVHTDKDSGITYDLNDEKQRINHILRNMIYGIAISELTSFVSRRTIYGVMEANVDKESEYLDSKIKAQKEDIDDGDDLDFNRYYDHTIFNTPDRLGYESEGNIFYPSDETTISTEDTHHPFINDTNHPFINQIKEGKMKFDVIIGNPPYQTSIVFSGKANSRATAIYHHFIDAAISLNPKYISMITPSRWLTKSAAGIPDAWVDCMINSNNLKIIYDFLDSTDCFSGVDINGGVSYFLWESNYNGKCSYNLIDGSYRGEVFNDYLNSSGLGFVMRDKKSITIVGKVLGLWEGGFVSLVSPKNFFTSSDRLTTNWMGYSEEKNSVSFVKYYLNKRLVKSGFGWISMEDIPRNLDSIDINKVYIPTALGCNYKVLGDPFLGEVGSVCSQTYLVIGFSPTEHNYSVSSCNNIISYIKTKFFRYLVSIKKKTQHAARGVYELVPMQDFNESWTDEKLYKKYNLTEEEINHIEESIRPME